MALKKKIILDNGITVNYHRIVSLNKITNKANIIEVASYTSEKKRLEEKEYYESPEEAKSMDVYINTTFINKEYNENETITEAYNYLKTLEQFAGAEDV